MAGHQNDCPDAQGWALLQQRLAALAVAATPSERVNGFRGLGWVIHVVFRLFADVAVDDFDGAVAAG